MDDLDAVLASLEHTEATLRSIPASSKDLEANFNDIDADLDAVFAQPENTKNKQQLNAELDANIEAIFDADPHLTHGDVSKLGVPLKTYQHYQKVSKNNIDDFKDLDRQFDDYTLAIKKQELVLYQGRFDIADNSLQRLFNTLPNVDEANQVNIATETATLTSVQREIHNLYNSQMKKLYVASKQEVETNDSKFDENGLELLKDQHDIKQNELNNYIRTYNEVNELYDQLLAQINIFKGEQMFDNGKSQENVWIENQKEKLQEKFESRKQKMDEKLIKQSQQADTQGKQADTPGQQVEAQGQDQNCTLRDYFIKIKREQSCVIRFEQYIRELKNVIQNTMPKISELNDEEKRGYFQYLQTQQLEARSNSEEAQKAVQEILQKTNAMKRVILDDNTDVKSDKLRDWKERSESLKQSFDEIESLFTDLYDNINRPKSQQHSKTEEKGDKKSSANFDEDTERRKKEGIDNDVYQISMQGNKKHIHSFLRKCHDTKQILPRIQNQIQRICDSRDVKKHNEETKQIVRKLETLQEGINNFLFQAEQSCSAASQYIYDFGPIMLEWSVKGMRKTQTDITEKEIRYWESRQNEIQREAEAITREITLIKTSFREKLDSSVSQYTNESKFQKKKESENYQFNEHKEKESPRDSYFPSTHHTTEQASVQHTEFSTRLNQFARTLIDLVYPPTPAPPWSTPSSSAPAHSIFSTKSNSTRSNPNKQLADLCNHIAHITAVSNRFPAIAAMRLLFEFSPNGALLSKFTQSQQSAKTVRPLQQHQNMDAIAKHLTGNRFSQLHRDADEFLSSFVSRAQQRASHEQLEDHENHEIHENNEKRVSHRENKHFMSRFSDYVTQTAHDYVEVHTPRAGFQKTQHTQQAARQESKKQESTEIDTSEQESTKNATGKEAAGQDSWFPSFFGRNRNHKTENKGRPS